MALCGRSHLLRRGENGESRFMDLGKVVLLVGKNPVGMVNIPLITRVSYIPTVVGNGISQPSTVLHPANLTF